MVKTTGARHAANLVSAVTAQGKLRFAAYEGRFTADGFIDFCKRLLADADGPVFLVVDGHPPPRQEGHPVRGLHRRPAVHLHPAGYLSELNPDEWV